MHYWKGNELKSAQMLPAKTNTNLDVHSFIDKEIHAINEDSSRPFVVWGENQEVPIEKSYNDINVGNVGINNQDFDVKRIHDLLKTIHQNGKKRT